MIKLKCNRCAREWDYKGKKKPNKYYNMYTSCPNCKTSVVIKEGDRI